jgi:hypothetical protein
MELQTVLINCNSWQFMGPLEKKQYEDNSAYISDQDNPAE